jgi:hypothetical protein
MPKVKQIIMDKGIRKYIFMILFFLSILSNLYSCNYFQNEDKHNSANEWIYFMNLFLINKIGELYENNVFPNHEYSFSIVRSKTINSIQFKQCIDIHKLKSLGPPNKIITPYDDLEKVAKCGTDNSLYIKCLKSATIYIEMQNFINDEKVLIDNNLSSISNDCKINEKGIIAF